MHSMPASTRGLRRGCACVLFLSMGGLASAEGDLERRVEALEVKLAEQAPPAPPGPELRVWFDRGLRFATADDLITARLGVNLVQHTRNHLGMDGRDAPDTFLLREGSIEVGARFDKSFEVFISPIYLPGSARLLYGWVEFNRWEEACIRAGQFKEPFSMEVLEETRHWDFVEPSVISIMAPAPDLGAMAHGRLLDGGMSYALGLFNGNGAQPGIDENSEKEVAVRYVWTPSTLIDQESRFHLHFGHSATVSRERRYAPVPPHPFVVPATGTRFLENPAADNYSIERIGRVNTELAFAWDRFELKGEFTWVRTSLDFLDDEHLRQLRTFAWYVQPGVWVTGSRRPFCPPVVEEPLFGGGFGSLQLAARYAHLRMNNVLTHYAGFEGSKSIHEYAAIVNWFLNDVVRVSLQYTHVRFRSGRVVLPSGDRISNEDSFTLRLQIAF